MSNCEYCVQCRGKINRSAGKENRLYLFSHLRIAAVWSLMCSVRSHVSRREVERGLERSKRRECQTVAFRLRKVL